MAKVECWFKQDLKKPVKVQTLNGSVFTLDNVGSLIGVEVYSDGEAVTLTGTVNGYVILPDETTVSVAGTRSENKAYIALPQSALAIPGFIRIAIKLTNSSEITTLLAVVATVYKSRNDTVITPSSQIITDWSQQIAAEMQAVEDASAAQDAKIDDIMSTLDELCDVPVTWTDGQYINTGGGRTTNENFSYSQFIDVPANVTIVIKSYMYGSASICLYTASQSFIEGSAITNSNPPTDKSILAVISSSTSARKVRVSCMTANKGAAYVYFCVSHSELEKVVNNALEQIGTRATAASGLLSDFNSALSNRVYTILDNSTIANSPDTSKTGVLMTFNGDASSANGQVQIFKNSTNDTYIRIKWSNAWTDWKKISLSSVSLEAIGARQNASTDTVISDLNSALPNRVYTITSGSAAQNLPVNVGGTLITFNGDPSYNGGQVQIYVSNKGEVYTRILWGAGSGTWTLWTNLENFGIRSYFSGIGMFSNFAVIGDSFANGLVCTATDLNGKECPSMAWGSVMSRKNGLPVTIYGWSGVGTYWFLDQTQSRYNTRGYGKLVSDLSNNKKELYLLCLGINDSNSDSNHIYGGKRGGLEYLGTSADINLTDYTQNENSFWGNYGKIIQTIMAESPKSRIVMCTFCRIPTTATSEAYSAYIEAIQQIAAFFSIPCLTLTDDAFFNSAFYMDNMVGHHPTPPQYAGYAQGIERLLSRAMLTYYDYFKAFRGLDETN